jgi:hypothetical protein
VTRELCKSHGSVIRELQKRKFYNYRKENTKSDISITRQKGKSGHINTKILGKWV